MDDVKDYLNKIYLGEVATVQNYGAFVRLPGTKHQGLVHKSQLSSSNVDDATEVLQKGDRIWCKVVAITDNSKISLSMKVVDQGSGKDLDPNGVQIFKDEQKRKSRPLGYQKKVIELGAILNTSCTKCGTRGHIANDCFKSPDGKTYELIPDYDDVPPISASLDDGEQKEKKKKKKHKKDKKHSKKTRKKKKEYSNSESSNSNTEECLRIKKRKKTKSKTRALSRSPSRKRKQ